MLAGIQNAVNFPGRKVVWTCLSRDKKISLQLINFQNIFPEKQMKGHEVSLVNGRKWFVMVPFEPQKT